MNIKDFYKQYINIDIGDIGSNQKEFISNELKSYRADDLRSLEDHKMFVELLQLLRTANIRDAKLLGTRFLATIKSLLSVGEDGVYSNSFRFLYELIQNVDDCDYENINDCRLDIQFDYSNGPGKIILTYNEKGFKPENVFSITGIAETSKNISTDKTEIGEKGIGFKSVFGIAEKVLIESGYFSFELYKDNFTVPIPKYDCFTPVQGTKLTLFMSAVEVEKIYRNIISQYIKGNAILNQNPILFLNKLTHLKMYFDDTKYIEFNVERKIPDYIGDIAFENDVNISIRTKGIDSKKQDTDKVIKCKRYTQPIIYGEKECKSRYGEDVQFANRPHNLVALFPTSLEDLKDFKGLMYSFLPTQIQMTAPIILHVPFKLDGSREFVHSQNENQWFLFTINHLESFLKKIYVHLATIVKQDIISYIPNRHDFFFNRTNEKVRCLQRNGLRGDDICSEKVFYTTEGTYESAKDIVSFGENENLENPIDVFELLDENSKLFVPNYSVNMAWYNVRVINNVPTLLFNTGLKDEKRFSKIADVLETIGKDLHYEDLIGKCCPLKLSKNQLMVINDHRTIYKAFNKYCNLCIKNNQLPQITFAAEACSENDKLGNYIKGVTSSVELEPIFERYLSTVGYRIFEFSGIGQEFAIAGQKGILVAHESPLGSFASLASKYDTRKILVATLRIRQASRKLNKAETDETMSNSEYLKLLREVRMSLKDAFGEEIYGNYINIINEAGTDKNRFLNELLQNADDCKYGTEEEPYFDLQMKGNMATATYNEQGFSKHNVRALTAIGESTKKLLLNGKEKTIGEKGVGFKSVFGVAKSVEVHSNEFDFILNDNTPTIPNKCKPLEGKRFGTTLIFNMKADVKQAFKEENILRLCICLRNLKNIRIYGTEIHISDVNNERIITVGKNVYHFERFTYQFKITDEEAISERSANNKNVDKEQEITCYISKEYKADKLNLYTGLPTTVECNVPLIIDAPFELTTSRDNVIENKWNDHIRNAVYNAIIQLMKSKKDTLKIDVLKYVKFTLQNNNISFINFSEPYLNRFDWLSKLRNAEIIPILNQKQFVSLERCRCIIVPEVIAYISKNNNISQKYHGLIVDTYKKTQYVPLLEKLGCTKSIISSDLDCVKQFSPNLIENEKFREILYTFLANPVTQQKVVEYRLFDKIKEMSIFPIKTRNGVSFVPFSKKIYTHSDKISDNDYLILDTEILDYETVQKIIGKSDRINELTQEIYELHYQKSLIQYIKSDKEDKEVAFFILNEFKNNFSNLKKCQFTLRGMINEIPMECIDGNYYTGNKFINKMGLILSGDTVQRLVVSKSFSGLAEYLGCTDIIGIHYDDIDFELEAVSDADIEDFQNEFSFGTEILENLIVNSIITDEQIEKYNLQYLIPFSGDEDEYEDFPGRIVPNLDKIKTLISNQFKFRPNPYVEKTQTIRVPKNPVNKEEYTASMYASENNSQKCFCQMCKNIVPATHIERNDVQKLPKYGWNQMYLSLCLNCSKDYILLRNNDAVWKKFISSILSQNIKDEETISIPIGNKELTFTAVHLAEIQAILSLENE